MNELCCAFCEKGAYEVRKLIAGPEVYICDECVGAAYTILKTAIPSLSGERIDMCRAILAADDEKAALFKVFLG